jgi:hypothetical protein
MSNPDIRRNEDLWEEVQIQKEVGASQDLEQTKIILIN